MLPIVVDREQRYFKKTRKSHVTKSVQLLEYSVYYYSVDGICYKLVFSYIQANKFIKIKTEALH